MTVQDTARIMDVLSTAYPQFYKGQTTAEKATTVRLWAALFEGDDPLLVANAVRALIVTDEKGFPPHIGAVKAKMRQLTAPPTVTDLEAWRQVRQAISDSIYGSAEEFAKLPSALQGLVGTPGQLAQWARMDEQTVESVVASNWMRAYRAKEQAQREASALPSLDSTKPKWDELSQGW